MFCISFTKSGSFIFNGKYLIVSPALIFKLKSVNNDTDANTTATPASSTTEQSIVDETIRSTPSFFKNRSLSMNDNEQLLFLDD